MEKMSKRKLRILCVGEGDFSCALALRKAYPHLIQSLVATSILPSCEELVATYPHATQILDDLNNNYENVIIMYSVDATKLHCDLHLNEMGGFDMVLFHHPHLGYHDDECNEDDEHDVLIDDSPSLAERHQELIRDYLYSAKTLLNSDYNESSEKSDWYKNTFPCIHLCLCGGTIDTWKVRESASDLDLQISCRSPFPASASILEYFEKVLLEHEESASTSEYSTCEIDIEQRIRNCQKGKRRGHWLGRFGYRHQPTIPSATTFSKPNISNSYHIFFTIAINEEEHS